MQGSFTSYRHIKISARALICLNSLSTSNTHLLIYNSNIFTQKAPPLVARYVPFVAVAAANCVNIPMMRQQEVLGGITVYTEQGQELGKSKVSLLKFGIGFYDRNS